MTRIFPYRVSGYLVYRLRTYIKRNARARSLLVHQLSSETAYVTFVGSCRRDIPPFLYIYTNFTPHVTFVSVRTRQFTLTLYIYVLIYKIFKVYEIQGVSLTQAAHLRWYGHESVRIKFLAQVCAFFPLPKQLDNKKTCIYIHILYKVFDKTEIFIMSHKQKLSNEKKFLTLRKNFLLK